MLMSQRSDMLEEIRVVMSLGSENNKWMLKYAANFPYDLDLVT